MDVERDMHGFRFADDGITLEVSLHAPPKSKTKSEKIEVIRFSEKGLLFDTHPERCSQGEVVRMTFEIPERSFKMSVAAKVVHLHVAGRRTERDCVEIEFVEFDSRQWQEVRDSFEDQQTRVTRAFNALKE